jgi:hypothetical protein
MPSLLPAGLLTDPNFTARLHENLNHRRVWEDPLTSGTILWALLSSLGAELTNLMNYARLLVGQIFFDLAAGVFLDTHGTTYGFPREQEESDGNYYTRIIDEITLERVTLSAVERVITGMGFTYHIYDNVNDSFFAAPLGGSFLVWIQIIAQDTGGFFDVNFCDTDPGGFFTGPSDTGKIQSLRDALNRIRATGITIVLERVNGFYS